MTYRVSRLPYARGARRRGHVRAKGLINTREQLESLFNAKEMGSARSRTGMRRKPAARR